MYGAQSKTAKQSWNGEESIEGGAVLVVLRKLVEEFLAVRVCCKPAQP